MSISTFTLIILILEGVIVVALVDGEATVKRLRRRMGKVWLEAANPAYKEIPFGENDLILGIIVGLWRRL